MKKNPYKDFKPGDLIEFAYNHNNQTVDKGEELWSRSMGKWIQIDGLIIFITQDGKRAYMMSDIEGFIHAHVDDADHGYGYAKLSAVHPRARG